MLVPHNDMINVTPIGSAEHDPCSDCGNRSRTIWGLVENERGPYAVYYARWTPGHTEDGAQVLISIGGWGEGTDSSEKRAVGLNSKMGEDRPGFSVVNAEDLPWSQETLLGRMLSREDALESGAADEAFQIIDQVVERDARLRSFYLSGA